MVHRYLAVWASNTENEELLAGSLGSLTPISVLNKFTLKANLLIISSNWLHLSECSRGCEAGIFTQVQVVALFVKSMSAKLMERKAPSPRALGPFNSCLTAVRGQVGICAGDIIFIHLLPIRPNLFPVPARSMAP